MSTEAGFLSMILGDEVEASTDDSNIVTVDDSNSQTMALLEANVSSISTCEDGNNEIATAENTNIFSSNALLPATNPLGVSDGCEIAIGGVSSDQISVYVVRKGDSISQIAEMFDVSIDTILSANDMHKGDTIKEGDVLLILPFSGIEHTVAKGDTLQGLANKYKVDLDEILITNDIDTDTKLAIGEKLMIPGGSLSGGTSKSRSGIKTAYPTSSLKNISGYFINPVPTGKKSRGTTSNHKGVDLAAPTGSPIYASAAGRVTFARTGYNGGFGNLVIISHANGTETIYAHQSRIATSVGAQVAQGDVIGYVGSTGRSSGPHLHFEVHGAKNPGNDWSWAR